MPTDRVGAPPVRATTLGSPTSPARRSKAAAPV